MITSDISNLFFEKDLTHCRDDDGGWKMHKLMKEAEVFLIDIEARTGLDYDAGELVDDFVIRSSHE